LRSKGGSPHHYREEEKRREEEDIPPSPQRGGEREDCIARIIDRYRELFDLPDYDPASRTVQAIRGRLKEFDEANILKAIAGLAASKYHRENGYTDLKYAVRNAEAVRMLMARNPAARPKPARRHPPRLRVPCECTSRGGKDTCPYTARPFCLRCDGWLIKDEEELRLKREERDRADKPSD